MIQQQETTKNEINTRVCAVSFHHDETPCGSIKSVSPKISRIGRQKRNNRFFCVGFLPHIVRASDIFLFIYLFIYLSVH